MIKTELDGTYTNWNKADAAHPGKVATVTSVTELIEVITHPEPWPCPVRAAGELHSTTACFDPGSGTLVFLEGDEFTRIAIDEARPGTVTVGARATMVQIRDKLRVCDPPRELAVSPEIGNATAGSVACAGTKDSTLNYEQERNLAQIGSLVTEVQMVDAAGRKLRVTDGGARDIETGILDAQLSLRLVRCSYGLLGIIYEVTFTTTEAVCLGNQFHWISLWRSDGTGIIGIDEVFGRNTETAAVLGFLQPYQPFAADPERRGMILVERRRRVAGGPNKGDELRRRVRDWMWEWGAHDAPTTVTKLADALRSHSVEEVRRAVTESVLGFLTSAYAAPLSADPEALLQAVQGVNASVSPQQFLQEANLAAATNMPGLAKGVLRWLGSLCRVKDYERPGWLLNVLDVLPGVLLVLGEYRSFRSDSLIKFGTERDNKYFDFTFWAFPASRWEQIIAKYLKFAWSYEQQHKGFRPTLFTEVYFICQDDRSLLSFAPDGPVFTLDIVDSRSRDEDWHAMNHAYNRWASGETGDLTPEERGRPLFNQTKHLATMPGVGVRKLLRDAFETRTGAKQDLWSEFSKAVWRANPSLPNCPYGRFVNPYFEKLLVPRGEA